MSPVTKPRYEVYTCLKRLQYGQSACDEKVLRRTDVDDAVFRYFESLAHDLDSIRSLATEALPREVADLAARQEEAEGEAAGRDPRLPEVEAEYLRGAIKPEEWGRFRARLPDALLPAGRGRLGAGRLRGLPGRDALRSPRLLVLPLTYPQILADAFRTYPA
jgi:hypothetical protein